MQHMNQKKNIITSLHDKSLYKGVNILYNLIKENLFWWSTITKDVRNYGKNCTICQIMHNQKFKKPFNKQIITKIPRDRYIVDNTYIDDSIK